MTNCVLVAKCPVPIIWVDTSVLLNLAKLKAGKNLREHDTKRMQSIQGRIQSLVKQGKLICPESDQQSEYFRTDSLFVSVFDDLSLGVKAKPLCMVEFDNIVRAMKAYVSNKAVQHSYLHAFHSDPVPEEFLDPFQQYRVRLVETWAQEHIGELQTSRNGLCADLETLRNQNSKEGITFEQQLHRELYDASTIRFKMIRGIEPTLKGLSYLNETNMHLEAWRIVTAHQGHNGDEADFYHSPFYHSIPSIDICARLYAALLTNNRKIRHGDSMDIRHISTFLPYADIMVVDKAMKRLVVDLKLDEKYGTKVVYVGDTAKLDAFFDECERLEARRKEWWKAPSAKPASIES